MRPGPPAPDSTISRRRSARRAGVGSRVVRNRGTWVESGCKSLTGFDVDPTVDPHHVVITQEIQCSGLTS